MKPIHIKNPLSIIALFSGVAESVVGLILGWSDDCSDPFLLYFVVFYPVLIVVLFFLILIFKHEALYAPSDFDDEKNFMACLKPKGWIKNSQASLKSKNEDGFNIGE